MLNNITHVEYRLYQIQYQNYIDDGIPFYFIFLLLSLESLNQTFRKLLVHRDICKWNGTVKHVR